MKARRIIGVLFLFMGAACLIFAVLQLKKYQEGNEEYQNIVAEYVQEPEDGDEDDFYLDWDSLYAQNQDLVGWIRMAPSVSYPIVRADNNSFYLHHGFQKTYNINGAIMMNCYNSPDWSDKNTVVYGHNMNNGSMFGSNKKYMDQSYTEKHPYFYIYTKDGRLTYRIFETMVVHDDSRPFETQFADDAAFGKYLDDIRPNRDYDLGVSVSEKDQIVTLSTCTRHGTMRFLIQGRLESFRDWQGNTITVEQARERQLQEEKMEETRVTESDQNLDMD